MEDQFYFYHTGHIGMNGRMVKRKKEFSEVLVCYGFVCLFYDFRGIFLVVFVWFCCLVSFAGVEREAGFLFGLLLGWLASLTKVPCQSSLFSPSIKVVICGRNTK